MARWLLPPALPLAGLALFLAARLQAAPEAGRVVIGSATRTALGGGATVEPLGPLDLKGKSEPVEAFVLIELGADSG